MTREPLCFWAWKKPPSSQKCTDQSSMNKPWLFKNLTLFRVYSIKRENPKKKPTSPFGPKTSFFLKSEGAALRKEKRKIQTLFVNTKEKGLEIPRNKKQSKAHSVCQSKTPVEQKNLFFVDCMWRFLEREARQKERSQRGKEIRSGEEKYKEVGGDYIHLDFNFIH